MDPRALVGFDAFDLDDLGEFSSMITAATTTSRFTPGGLKMPKLSPLSSSLSSSPSSSSPVGLSSSHQQLQSENSERSLVPSDAQSMPGGGASLPFPFAPASSSHVNSAGGTPGAPGSNDGVFPSVTPSRVMARPGSTGRALGQAEFNRNSHKRDRVAVERDAVAGLRTELIAQGALPPVARDVAAAGGRSLDMAMPRATVLAAALRQLAELRTENARLASALEARRNVTPRYMAVGPPGGSTCFSQSGFFESARPSSAGSLEVSNFESWAFQYSSVPTCILFNDNLSCRIVSCNRSFGALLGLASPDDAPGGGRYAFDGGNPRLPSGDPLTWNAMSRPDFHVTPAVEARFARGIAAALAQVAGRASAVTSPQLARALESARAAESEHGVALSKHCDADGVCKVVLRRWAAGGGGNAEFLSCFKSMSIAQVRDNIPTALCLTFHPCA